MDQELFDRAVAVYRYYKSANYEYWLGDKPKPVSCELSTADEALQMPHLDYFVMLRNEHGLVTVSSIDEDTPPIDVVRSGDRAVAEWINARLAQDTSERSNRSNSFALRRIMARFTNPNFSMH